MLTPKIPVPGLRSIVTAALLANINLTGCSSQGPCLQYTPQSVTRTVSMRGFGMVQTTEEALVCTHRADSDIYALN